LPPLAGCLAIPSNRLVRIHPRFAGEVVALGSVGGGEANTPAGESPTAGRPLRLGDRVQKDQLLAVVWSKDLGEKKSELVDTLSRLKLDREVLARLQELFAKGATAERNVREAERNVESDLIAVARVERTLLSWRLSETEIAAIRTEAEQLPRSKGVPRADYERWARVEVRAPQGGVILEMNTALGDLVDTTADLFKIADLRKLTVWAHIYEEELPVLLQLPRPIAWKVTLPAQPGVAYPGVLDRVGDLIDPNQHTALVTGQVDNADGKLRVGQYVNVTIEVPASPDEVEVPATALVEDGVESVVFVQPDPDKPHFVKRRVAVVRRGAEVVVLRCGKELPAGCAAVKAGERVVVGGAVLLKDALGDLPLATAER
jgi:cobalt-zinc-cadmium efflux system membrane fusion protein